MGAEVSIARRGCMEKEGVKAQARLAVGVDWCPVSGEGVIVARRPEDDVPTGILWFSDKAAFERASHVLCNPGASVREYGQLVRDMGLG